MQQAKTIDAHIWIENPRCPPDPTLTFGRDMADFVILNDGTLDEYRQRLEAFVVRFGMIYRNVEVKRG